MTRDGQKESNAVNARRALAGTGAFYVLIAFEFLYMASPFAAYFYGVYGLGLDWLRGSPTTSWLIQFFMPHLVEETTSLAIDFHETVGSLMLLAGLAAFAAGAVQVYSAKLRGRGAVTGGLYRHIRHPQYLALIVASIGMLLLWPRYLVVVATVTVIFVYVALVEAQRDTLAAASHELRSSLARIRVAVELLAENGDPALRSRAERDIAELDDLIEEILLASRLAGLEPPLRSERIDLRALVAEEAARAGAGFSGGPATVEGESRLLVRLVRNLLDNAACHAADSPVVVGLEQRGGCAVVRVSDRGPGVPEAERERIFEPFYRRADGRAAAGPRTSEDPNDQRGAGLGLSLVRGIARRHGGEAICLPRDEGGACFEVCLPMARTKVTGCLGISPK